MVLNLIKNGQNTHAKMLEYTNSTMWAENIRAQIEAAKKTVQEKTAKIETKIAAIKSLESSTDFVPHDTCKQYNEWMKNMSMYSQKKRKEIEREIAELKTNYRQLLPYCEKYKELAELETELHHDTLYLEHITTIIEYQIDKICDILIKYFGLITFSETGEYFLTELGKISANMAELHPVLCGNVFEYTNKFELWTPTDFIVYLSCFTQIKVDEEYKRLSIPDTIGRELRDIIKWTQTEIELLQDMETRMEIYTGINYNDMMTYDLVEEIDQWTRCETEQQCKYFIQTVLADRGISVGDFTKAVLKIATVAREWKENCGVVAVSHVLSQVDELILKYVTTCQSLYV